MARAWGDGTFIAKYPHFATIIRWFLLGLCLFPIILLHSTSSLGVATLILLLRLQLWRDVPKTADEWMTR